LPDRLSYFSIYLFLAERNYWPSAGLIFAALQPRLGSLERPLSRNVDPAWAMVLRAATRAPYPNRKYRAGCNPARRSKPASQDAGAIRARRRLGAVRTGASGKGEGSGMDFVDKILKCADCGNDFVFTAGEQLFFFDKQFKNDPKRCKQCKAKRASGSGSARPETRTVCSECGTETTVPFKPTQGRPVLCRSCFQQKRTLSQAS
jgi:CxxC-x17-CxxC domain-containing protein